MWLRSGAPRSRSPNRWQWGNPRPPRARLSPLPASVGLRNPYRYSVVNDRTVLVDPRTGRIVEIIQ
ncbi:MULTISPECIES: DUF1236 domain-containing protein [Microvirga]|uniref:DUF1236 domain-containing protein n=1 Tax=Microvirga TaxID=186650 RepID=UPI0035305102